MDGPGSFGKLLVAIGLGIALLGVLLLLAGKVPFLGKLPGDITVQGKRVTFYAPLGTSLLLSLIVTAVLTVIGLLFRR